MRNASFVDLKDVISSDKTRRFLITIVYEILLLNFNPLIFLSVRCDFMNHWTSSRNSTILTWLSQKRLVHVKAERRSAELQRYDS